MEPIDRDEFERSLRHAVAGRHPDAVDSELGALGWLDALAEHPRDAVSILFGLLGSEHASSSALGVVLAQALGLAIGPDAGMVLAPLGTTSVPGVQDGERIVVGGLAAASLCNRSTAVVVVDAMGSTRALGIPTKDLSFRPVQGMDPDLRLVEVTGAVHSGSGEPLAIVSPWPSAIARAHLAVGHELVGTSRTMLELARRHALERVQFGKTIATFQAVRHRLAETIVAIESADAVLDAAWEDGSVTTAAVAKALAGRCARTAARHCQQVLAGIGFTSEHPFHLYARRVFVLDSLFGSSRMLTARFGADLLATRRLPAFAPL